MKKVLKNKKIIYLSLVILLLVIGCGTYFILKNSKKENLNVNTQEETPLQEEKYYKIIFDTNGGNSLNPITIKEGEKIIKPENPTRDGYEFITWLYNETEYDFETIVQEDMTLKASWKKVENKESTTKETTTKKNTTSTTTNSSSSTIDKINLNDYISVTINYYNYAQPGGYYFITNFDSVFPQLAGKSSITVGWDEETVGENGIDILLKDWEDAVNTKFTYNTAKENNAKSIIEKIKNENKKGILFTPQIDNHGIDYQYEYLTISNTSYKSLNNSLVESKDSIKSEIGSIFNDAIRVTLPGYAVWPKHDTLLTEEVCNEYHLTCSRW